MTTVGDELPALVNNRAALKEELKQLKGLFKLKKQGLQKRIEDLDEQAEECAQHADQAILQLPSVRRTAASV